MAAKARLAARLQYSRVIAGGLSNEVAPGSWEEANREEIRTGNYANRSERLRVECEGGFDAAGELDRNHQ
jgi:hypothetical protein